MILKNKDIKNLIPHRKPFLFIEECKIINRGKIGESFKIFHEDEYFFELKPVFCEKCFSFQIEEQPAPELMFHDQYAFFSRTSTFMQQHFKAYANWVCDNHLKGNDLFVVEIGSNEIIKAKIK